MKKFAIIALLSCCCILIHGQSITFSRTFEAKKKNVAVAIINNHPGYFHVLRYNKAVHDITIERRNKPNATILAFTPLKLDSVNAGWFNYEKLDYLWYEEDHKLFFVFEKVLNSKSTIYLKVIDTLGKASGFIELSSMQADPGVGLEFTFSRGAGNTILIVGAMTYPNGITKKSAVLYDVNTHKTIWIKKLPHENSFSEKTEGFTTNLKNDLLYIHYNIKSMMVIKRGNTNQNVINEFGDISVIKSYSESKDIITRILNLKNIEAVYAATLMPEGENIIFTAQVVEEDLGNKPYLHVEKINRDLSETLYMHKHAFPINISEQLTFYDGTNYKEPAYKNYALKESFILNDQLFFITQRKDENYYKELLAWRLDVKSGLLKKVEIIPRKIFYFDDRTRFRKMAECITNVVNDSLRFYLLEEPGNFATSTATFKYHAFSKQTNLWGGNIVCYISGPTGNSVKKLIYRNKNFDLVPMPYYGHNKSDEVFYLNEGSYEKFGFISLQNP